MGKVFIMKIFFLLIILTLPLSKINAQKIKESNDIKNSKDFLNISFIKVGGNYINMNFEELNDRLKQYELPSSFKNGVILPSVGFSLTSDEITNRAFASAHIGYASKERKTENFQNESKLLNIGFDINYTFVKYDPHQFYAKLGFGWSNLDMEFTDLSQNNSEFDANLNEFYNQNLSSSNLFFISLGSGYMFLFNEFYIDAQAGYRISLNQASWENRLSNLDNGPSLNASGFYIGIYIGLQDL